jgi:hypothetical protein
MHIDCHELMSLLSLQTIFSEDAMSIGDGTRQIFVPTGFYRVSNVSALCPLLYHEEVAAFTAHAISCDVINTLTRVIFAMEARNISCLTFHIRDNSFAIVPARGNCSRHHDEPCNCQLPTAQSCGHVSRPGEQARTCVGYQHYQL